MNFKDQESSTKLRGGYYTPEPVASFLTRWVLHKTPKKVLEPSCGDGAFVKTFSQLAEQSVSFTGIEVSQVEADKARTVLDTAKFQNDSCIFNADFLEWAIEQLNNETQFDAVVGNPPYIRYQYLEANDQALAAQIFTRYRLHFTKHTNAWVPFVIASISLLAPSGRLAMVIPSEILHVLHANSLRSFLLDQCHRVMIIDPTELLFEEALQGTVLLMVEKKTNLTDQSDGVSVVPAINNDFLLQDPELLYTNATFISGSVLKGKWMKVFLTSEELSTFEKATNNESIYKFDDIATVDVGIVTGANKFFLVDDATVNEYSIQEYTKPMFGRSEHCPGIIYNDLVHATNKERGMPTNFVIFGNTPFESLSREAQAYVRLGEEQSLHTRYKCRIRSPWYSVPSVYSTPIGMLKRSHNYPRLILNSLGAYTTDTAYRIRIKSSEIPEDKLVFCFINSLTALTAELEGRHYGGGVLELVPSEIEKLQIPIPKSVDYDIEKLDNMIRSGVSSEILLEEQDKIVLGSVGLTEQECRIIHHAWRRIRDRRQRLVENEG